MIDDDQDSPTPPARAQSRVVYSQVHFGHQGRRGMDIEVPVVPVAATPVSSPKPRSSGSASADTSSNSVGSSLDTASASAHLERYDVPWGIMDLSVYRDRLPRRTRSYNAFLEWQAAGPIARNSFKQTRPLAGASRRRLIRQIQQLTKDKADLQAQLAAIATSSASAIPGMIAVTTSTDPSLISNDAAPLLSSSTSSMQVGQGSQIDGMMGTKSSGILPSMTLELIAALSDRLIAAIDTSTTIMLSENDKAQLERPGMRALLQKSSMADPHKDLVYAQIFARRFVEVQKRPELRSEALRPGTLQQSVKHPSYVDVLMKGLREPFIAHYGAFDDTELGLWILNGIQFHSEALGDTAELDDDFFEIPAEMFVRFPFIGTKEMIESTNRWRTMRGEELFQQTPEMIAAEEYTRSRQLRMLENNPS